MPKRRLTQEQRNAVVRSYCKHRRLRIVAEQFGITPAAVKYIVNRHGISTAPLTRWEVPTPLRPQILAEFAKGRSIAETAEILGTTPSKIIGTFRHLGVPMGRSFREQMPPMSERQMTEYLSCLNERIPHADAIEVALEY